MKNISNYLKTHKRIFFLLYFPFYMLWFTALERWTNRDWHIIHCTLDDATPFVEYFIIPYYVWFVFVAFFCVYFYFKAEPMETVRMYTALVLGMTITLIIYTVWPNAIHLRPEILEGDSICKKLVKNIWKMDTDTNVCPSLHVLNTLVILVAIHHARIFGSKKLPYVLTFFTALLICLSTGFLKQHSWIDVLAAVIFCIILCIVVYVPDWKFFRTESKQRTE